MEKLLGNTWKAYRSWMCWLPKAWLPERTRASSGSMAPAATIARWLSPTAPPLSVEQEEALNPSLLFDGEGP